MSATAFQPHQAAARALAFLAMGVLMLDLSACASKPGKPQATHPTDSGKPCVGENARPNIQCAASPAAAFDKTGQLWAVWHQDGRLYLSHSNDLGHTFSEPATVTTTTDIAADTRPDIVVSKDGAIYLAWATTGHIYFSRSLDHGRTFAVPIQANSESTDIVPHSESLAVNDRSYVYLAWADRQAGRQGGAAVYVAFSNNGGRSFHSEKKIADAADGCCRVSMKIDRQKLPVLLWQQAFGGHALTHYAAKDQPGPIQALEAKTEACPHPAPSLAVDPRGDYQIAWSAAEGLYFSGSDDQGKHFSTPAKIRQAAQPVQPDILADERSIHITWTESDGKKTQLFEQDSIDGGLSWSMPRTLAETEGDSDDPSLLAYQDHHYIAWQTKDQGFRLIGLGD